jgi:hypothetical protein
MEVTKAKQSSRRINHASKGVDESIWAVQPHGARDHKATKEHGVHWRKTELGVVVGTQPD